MNTNFFEAIVPFLGGLYATLIAYNVVSVKYTINPSIKKLLKWLGPLVIVFSIFLACKPVQGETPDLQAVASQINEQLPAMIDQDTKIEEVQARRRSTLQNYDQVARRLVG